MRYKNDDNLSKRGDRNRKPGCWTIFGLDNPVRRAVEKQRDEVEQDRRGPKWREMESKQQFDYEEAMEAMFS